MMLEVPRHLSEQIYEHLCFRIFSRELEPGEHLTQEKIAKEFNISRTPLREAFQRLEQEGLVERMAKGGVRVMPIDPDSIAQKFGVRQALEIYAIELACDQISNDVVSELQEIEYQAKELLTKSNLEFPDRMKRFFELNTDFHDRIYEATGNPYLIKMIQHLRQTVLNMRASGLRDRSTWEQVWKEHGELIKHLKSRNKEAAVQCMKQHIKNAASYVISELSR